MSVKTSPPQCLLRSQSSARSHGQEGNALHLPFGQPSYGARSLGLDIEHNLISYQISGCVWAVL